MFDRNLFRSQEGEKIYYYLEGNDPEEFRSRLKSSETFRIEVTLEILHQLEQTLRKERRVMIELEEQRAKEAERKKLHDEFLQEGKILKDLFSSLGISSPVGLIFQDQD